MQLRSDAKIQSTKEEGDPSHSNQSYKKYVAVQDKATKK